MAEGYYNHYTQSNLGTSAALIEDRREKFNHSPSDKIQEVMQEDGIDISRKKIKLLTDATCKEVERIILLLDLNTNGIKSEFDINGENAVDYLNKNHQEKIMIIPIDDPYGLEKEGKLEIRDKIKKIIQQIIE